jgi:hypothetical protein
MPFPARGGGWTSPGSGPARRNRRTCPTRDGGGGQRAAYASDALKRDRSTLEASGPPVTFFAQTISWIAPRPSSALRRQAYQRPLPNECFAPTRQQTHGDPHSCWSPANGPICSTGSTISPTRLVQASSSLTSFMLYALPGRFMARPILGGPV